MLEVLELASILARQYDGIQMPDFVVIDIDKFFWILRVILQTKNPQ
jgi:hypothetical protein